MSDAKDWWAHHKIADGRWQWQSFYATWAVMTNFPVQLGAIWSMLITNLTQIRHLMPAIAHRWISQRRFNEENVCSGSGLHQRSTSWSVCTEVTRSIDSTILAWNRHRWLTCYTLISLLWTSLLFCRLTCNADYVCTCSCKVWIRSCGKHMFTCNLFIQVYIGAIRSHQIQFVIAATWLVVLLRCRKHVFADDFYAFIAAAI